MGASHSKKKRKERRKRKHQHQRSSPLCEIPLPRSASADVIRTMSVSSSSRAPTPTLTSSCPYCQHPNHSLSWSESLSTGTSRFGHTHSHYRNVHHHHHHHHHPCLHGQYEEMRMASGGSDSGAGGFESCPNCYSSSASHQQQQQRPGRHSDSFFPAIVSSSSDRSHGRGDQSTMSLNRSFHQHHHHRHQHQQQQQEPLQQSSSNRNCMQEKSPSSSGGASGDLEFSRLLEILERQKDDRSSLPKGFSSSSSSPPPPAPSCARVGASPVLSSHPHPRPTPVPASSLLIHQQVSAAAASPIVATDVLPLSCSFPVPADSSSPMTTSPSSLQEKQRVVADNQHVVVSKANSKISLLEDEETKVSRWIKRKQMAQQLRDLRKHLENNQSSSAVLLPAPLLTTGIENHSQHEDEDVLSFRQSNDQLAGADAAKSDDALADPSSVVDACSLTSSSPTRRVPRSKFSRMSNYRYLDNHPVMTRLQNEQNNRLESMEKRMKEIRISAMQEAERRKFAEIFPAKDNDSETQQLLQEAQETLEKLKEEKRRKMQYGQGQQEQQQQPPPHDLSEQSNQTITDNDPSNSSVLHDSGEIIPVCVVPSRDIKSSLSKFRGIIGRCEKTKEVDKKDKPFWLKSDWPEMNLNQPLTWLLLPFLLFPLILRMLLSLIINTSTPTALSERGSERGHVTSSGSSSNGGNSGDDPTSGRRRSSDGHVALLARLGSKKCS